MLTTVSRLSPRAKAVHARTSATRILGPASSVVIRQRHQTRAFRLAWGWCSSHEDAENHREIRRRHRMLRHKYAESVRRKLSWEQHPEAEEASRTFRRIASPHWVFKNGTRSDAYHVKIGKVRTPDNPNGVRPGRNIEDVERGAMDHFLFGDIDARTKWAESQHDRWTAPLQNICNYMASRQEELRSSIFGTSETSASSHAQTDQDDYVIDPITNRKVPKTAPKPAAPTSSQMPDDLVGKYQSWFDRFPAPSADKPIFCDGPPPPSELRQYRQVEIDDALSHPENQGMAGAAADSDLPPTADELHRYSQVDIDDVDSDSAIGQHAGSSSTAGPESADPAPTEAEMRKYESVVLDENPVDHIGEHSTSRAQGWLSRKPVVESDSYVQDHEPNFDVAYGPEQTYLSWRYKNVSKRGDGGQAGNTAAPSAVAEPKYEDLDRYKPVMYNETASTEQATAKYSDLDKYEAALEPEIERQVDSAPPVYEDLGKYNPFRYHEPDGKQPGQLEAEETPEDAKLYKPFLYNEPDGKPPGAGAEELGYDAAELRKYGAFRWNEPDGRPACRDDQAHRAREAAKYRPVMYNEPDGKPQAFEAESVDPAELGGYGALRYQEPDGKPNAQPAETADAIELGRYNAVRYNEPDGKASPGPDAVTEGLKEFDSSADNSWISQSAVPPEADESYAGILRRLERLSTALENEEGGGKLEPARSQQQAGSKADAMESSSVVQAAAEKRYRAGDAIPNREAGLKGNYVQDFPEEFSQTWTSSQDSSATLRPKDAADSTKSTDFVDGSAPLPQTVWAEGKQSSSSKLEPSLDRQFISAESMTEADRAQALADPYSKEPQGLETSYTEECDGKPTWPTFVKIRKCTNEARGEPEMAAPAATQDAHSAQPLESTEPTVYKILAYDPTMQTINVAETTSVVPDTASALTPAEVLLRLSNPSKFFPHFAPLQAQGFEIVSGSGDVLVFRKVHDVAAAPEPETASALEAPKPAEQPPVHAPAAVNPIDMTGTLPMFPAAANFASPTGYVNYDMPSLEEAARLPPPPAPGSRFRSNIEVRREEPVFSGRKSDARGQKDKPHVGKRMLVGAVWVASVSYAIGVVGEYFKTGGIDGMGPKGF